MKIRLVCIILIELNVLDFACYLLLISSVDLLDKTKMELSSFHVQGKKLKEFGAVNFDETLDSLQNATTIYVPNWCTISSNLGVRTLSLFLSYCML